MSNINRWEPFQDMLTLREAMNQLFEESFVPPQAARHTQSGFIPALNLSETKDGYRVELAVPGLKAEDLDVTVENNVLTIKGEIHRNTEDKDRNYHRIERSYGAFHRAVTLPSKVRSDAITANLQDGVLQLEIPKAEEVKPRKISVSNEPAKALEVHNN